MKSSIQTTLTSCRGPLRVAILPQWECSKVCKYSVKFPVLGGHFGSRIVLVHLQSGMLIWMLQRQRLDFITFILAKGSAKYSSTYCGSSFISSGFSCGWRSGSPLPDQNRLKNQNRHNTCHETRIFLISYNSTIQYNRFKWLQIFLVTEDHQLTNHEDPLSATLSDLGNLAHWGS